MTFTVLYFRYLDAKADNRLDGGIDPAWLTPEREASGDRKRGEPEPASRRAAIARLGICFGSLDLRVVAQPWQFHDGGAGAQFP